MMKTKFNGILTLLLAFTVHFAFAQKTVSGTVSDDTGPLPGVSVLIKGTSTGTETDFDGKYTIQVKTGEVLQYSYVGMETAFKTVGGSNFINVKMKSSEANILEEVVIQAYGIKRAKPKSNVSVTTVNAETIESRPNASLVQTLQGQIAGLNISTGTGQPGANSEVILRGAGSITGNVEPLFIIDGVPVDEDNFRSLNSNDIASVTVLKDAGATAIYGSRGANGAIIITTTRGKYNSDMKISYSGMTGFATTQDNKYDLMNASEQLTLERNFGNGRGVGMTDAEIATVARYSNTNWNEVFFRTGLSQNHTLSINKGGENIASFTSLSYLNQDGILVDSNLKRFSVRNNMDGKSTNEKFNLSSSLSVNYSKSNTPNSIGSGAINRNYALGGYISVPYISPNEYTPGEGGIIPVVFANTPLFLLDRLDTYTRLEEEVKLLGNIRGNYKILNGLTYNTSLGSEFTEVLLTRSESPTSFNAILFAQTGNDTPGFQQQNSIRTASFNFVNSLNYSRIFNDKHTLDLGAYMEYFKAHYRGFGYFAEGLDPHTFSPGDGSGLVADNSANDWYVDTASANINNAGLLSYFGTFDYDFDQKYGVSATLRRDASYRFRETNRWGTFYSASARWNINNESFMENSIFDLLKLRASYGTTGNQRIEDAVGQNAYFTSANRHLDLYSVGSGYIGQGAIWSSQTGNPSLKWETVKQANIGLDFGIWKSRLGGTFDVYKKETSDLFTRKRTPSISGVTSLFFNSGELINKGIEVSLFGTILQSDTDGLNLRLSFIGNYNKSERYGADDTTIQDGGPLGEYFVYRYVGVNPANGNLLFLDKDDNITENPDQDLDRVFTGKTRYPDYQGSFGFESSLKNFFLNATFTYAIGIDRFDWDLQGFHDPNSIGQFRHSRDVLNAWTPDNRITNIPSLTATNYDMYNGSDMYMQSGDYLRLRFINFGYSIPKKHLSKLGLEQLKAFISAENWLTFSGWRGFDVESFATSSQWEYPTPKQISLGLEIGF